MAVRLLLYTPERKSILGNAQTGPPPKLARD